MVRREQLVTVAETTLNGGISNSATSITVTDGSVFPSVGDYRILIDDEVLLVKFRSTHTLTVIRGQDGTANVIHSDLDVVKMLLTAGALDQRTDDTIPAYSDRIAHKILNGSAVTLTASSFSWVNQGTSTVSDDTWGGITLKLPNTAGVSLRCLVKTAPSTPWVLTGHVATGPGYGPNVTNGLMMRESGTNKICVVSQRPGSEYNVSQYTDATTFSSSPPAAVPNCYAQATWFQIEDDGTDIYFRISQNAVKWQLLYSELRGAFFTTGPDQIGWFANNNDGFTDQLHHLTAWLEA